MSRRRGRPAKNIGSTGQPIPGGGTQADIQHLSRSLGMTTEAVEGMMAAQGAGLNNARSRRSAPSLASAPAATSSAWADFMSDEMDSSTPKKDESPSSKATADSDPSKSEDGSSRGRKKGDKSAKSKDEKGLPNYKLPLKPVPLVKNCLLAQTGTLDSNIVGRGSMNLKVRNVPNIDLCEPTLLFPKSLFPKVKIGSIAASPSSCHTIAIDTQGGVYAWGRNEDGQLGLGPDMPSICVPRKVTIPGKEKMQCAAVGKHHSILISQDGGVWGCGSNKLGQLGINSSVDSCNTFRRSMFVLTDEHSINVAKDKKPLPTPKKRSKKLTQDEGTSVTGTVLSADGDQVKFIMAACGEQFSVILSSVGQIYTTGASESGQLGNGATGEHFITASKIAFTNCNRFEPRTHFVASQKMSFTTGTDDKKAPIYEDIRIGHIACGKNHTVAVEAAREGKQSHLRRVFSWGCGDYGCLGHGIQADEYYPRQLAYFKNKVFEQNPPVFASCGAQCILVLSEKGHGYYVGRHRSVGDATMRPQLLDALASNGHIVTGMSAGAQTIICCTKSGVTVTWGNGQYGDLGYGADGGKSSAKPQFVSVMDSIIVTRVASGYGSTIFLVRDEDAEDKKALKKLKKVEKEDVESYEIASILRLRQPETIVTTTVPADAAASEEGDSKESGKRKLEDDPKSDEKKIKT